MKDNYSQVSKALAAYILDNAPSGLKERSVEQLNVIVNLDEWGTYIYLDWDRKIDEYKNVSGSLYITLQDDNKLTNENGDVFVQHSIKTLLSFDGKQDTVEYWEAASFLMVELTSLVRKIQHNFSEPIYTFLRSREEEETNKRVEEQGRLNRLVRDLLRNNKNELKGMRVGSSRTITSEQCKELPAKTYEVNYDDKFYAVSKSENAAFTYSVRVCRTA
jgi:hypothetical protein